MRAVRLCLDTTYSVSGEMPALPKQGLETASQQEGQRGIEVSATIHYRNASKADPSLSVNAPSSFIEALERAFSPLPVVLGEDAIPVLQGMMAVSRGESGYEDLIEKITHYGTVEVYASW
jgi:hypothetical protein